MKNVHVKSQNHHTVLVGIDTHRKATKVIEYALIINADIVHIERNTRKHAVELMIKFHQDVSVKAFIQKFGKPEKVYA